MEAERPESEPAACPDCGRRDLSVAHVVPIFCPWCGQRLRVSVPQTRDLLRGLVDAFTSFGGPVWETLCGLARSPGRVSAAWISGRRRSLVHPVKFLAVVGTVTYLLRSPLHKLRSALWPTGTAMYSTDAGSALGEAFALFALLLLIPVSGLTLVVARWLGVRRTFPEWYVLGAYTFGFGALLQLVWELLGLVVPGGRSGVYSALEFLLPLAVYLFGAYGFTEPGRRWRAAFAAVVGLSGVVLVIVLFHGLQEVLLGVERT